MAVTILEEIDHSGGYSNGRLRRTRVVHVAWSDRLAFEAEIAPPPVLIGGTIDQPPGAPHPENSLLRVVSYDYRGYGAHNANDPFGLAGYERAVFTIQYETPQATVDEDETSDDDPVVNLTHRISGGGQMLEVNNGLRWSGDELPASEDFKAGKFVGTDQHTIVWPKVPFPNWTALTHFKGHVNASNFKLRGYVYPPETVMYLNYEAERDIMSDGSRAWRLTMNFEVKVVPADDDSGNFTGGHNHFWREDQYGFWRLEDEDGGKIFKTANFNLLFTSGGS